MLVSKLFSQILLNLLVKFYVSVWVLGPEEKQLRNQPWEKKKKNETIFFVFFLFPKK